MKKRHYHEYQFEKKKYNFPPFFQGNKIGKNNKLLNEETKLNLHIE